MSGRSALLFYVCTARKESHAYFRNPSHLINSLDARKYDTKSHVLDPQWAKNNYKISAKRVNYKIERLIVYHGTQIHHTTWVIRQYSIYFTNYLITRFREYFSKEQDLIPDQ